MATTLQTMALTAILLLYLTLSSHHSLTNAREIIGTNEWQLLGENDTVPSGLHIKLDLETGQRWARLVQDEEDGEKQGVVMDAELDGSGALTITSDSEDTATSTDTSTEENPPTKDYEMMHRVMSRLPPEELERFGGLPALPIPQQSHDKEGVLSISPEERAEFESKMERIWKLRQEELRQFQQENLADLPTVLKERIQVLREYILDPQSGRTKVLEKRLQTSSTQEIMSEEEEVTTANDIIESLKDLEYQLSDIDHARDFHTLGGWTYLVALLQTESHFCCHRDINGQAKTKDEEEKALTYEIQALAAMTIGTAVGNLGEFRSWALEDVSSAVNEIWMDSHRVCQDCSQEDLRPLQGPISALSSLVSSFENEKNPSQHTLMMTDKSTQDHYRTYKLRAVYALGSLLRGNALAQQHFVSKNGPDALVRYTLGILSSVNGENVGKVDYKLASKVLALGEDIVMAVLLEDDYQENDTNMEDKDDMLLTPNRMVAAFTTEPWCDLSLQMLSPPIQLVGESQARSFKERALSAIRALGPVCKVNHQLQCSGSSNECTEEGLSWGVPQIMRVRSEWNREGSGDGLDSVYRRELLELVDGVLEALQ